MPRRCEVALDGVSSADLGNGIALLCPLPIRVTRGAGELDEAIRDGRGDRRHGHAGGFDRCCRRAASRWGPAHRARRLCGSRGPRRAGCSRRTGRSDGPGRAGRARGAHRTSSFRTRAGCSGRSCWGRQPGGACGSGRARLCLWSRLRPGLRVLRLLRLYRGLRLFRRSRLYRGLRLFRRSRLYRGLRLFRRSRLYRGPRSFLRSRLRPRPRPFHRHLGPPRSRLMALRLRSHRRHQPSALRLRSQRHRRLRPSALRLRSQRHRRLRPSALRLRSTAAPAAPAVGAWRRLRSRWHRTHRPPMCPGSRRLRLSVPRRLPRLPRLRWWRCQRLRPHRLWIVRKAPRQRPLPRRRARPPWRVPRHPRRPRPLQA